MKRLVHAFHRDFRERLMKKRTFAGLTAMALAVTVIACGQQSQQAADKAKESASKAADAAATAAKDAAAAASAAAKDATAKAAEATKESADKAAEATKD